MPAQVQELSERITRPFYDAWNDAGKVFKRLSSEKQKETQVATYTYLHGARYIEPPALLAAVAETVPDFLVKLRGVVQSWFLSDEPDDVSQTLSAQHLSLSPPFPEQNQNPESESEPEQGTLPPANAPNVTYITEPVIERIIENSAQGGVSETTLSARLQDLASTLNDRIQNAFLGAARSAVVQNVSDITVDGVTGLVDADIPDGITASNYLLLTGGTLTGSLTGTSLTLSGDLTVSGAQTLSGAITIPYLSATSTTASSFIQASTTRFSVFDTAYFGGSATSTFDSAGNLSVAGTLTATNGLSTLSNLLTTGSSTLQNFTFVNATGTSATSTNFAISGISSGSLLKTTTGGAVIAAVAGTDYAAASSVFAFPWSATTNYAAAANSTSTPIWFQQGLQASSTSQIAYASTTAITATTASTTNLIASNSFTLASLTGFLKATAGAVATSLIDLTSDITGILGVTNGGTGWGDIQANSIVLGNGAGALATTTAGTDGQVLALSNGVPGWTATTTFAGGLTYANGSVTLDWMFPGNATTTGLGLYASTTIGAGGQATGLTISGGATTTGNLIVQGTGNSTFAGNVGIGTTTLYSKLSVWGASAGNIFEAITSASSSALTVSATGFGTTTVTGLTVTGSATSTSDVGWNIATGCFAINDECVGGGATLTGTTGQLAYFSGTDTAAGTSTLFISTASNVGIGTTSPYAKLSVWGGGSLFEVTNTASTTLFAVADGALGSIFTFGQVSTSTVPNNQPYAWTIATSTTASPLFRIDSTTGSESVSFGVSGSDVVIGDVGAASNLVFEENSVIKGQGAGRTLTFGANSDTINFAVKLGIGTTTPWRTLSVVGTVALNGLTAAASGNLNVCINNTTKDVFLGASATSCTPSSIRFKHDVLTSQLLLNKMRALRPVTFLFNDGGDPGEQIGFIAEEVFLVDPRLVQLDADGLPGALKLDNLLALTIKSLQEVDLNLETLSSTTASTTPQSESFAASFWSNLFSRLTSWFADAANGIGEVFARVFNASEKICVDGECLNADDIRALKQIAGVDASHGGGGGGGGSISPAPAPEPSPSPELPQESPQQEDNLGTGAEESPPIEDATAGEETPAEETPEETVEGTSAEESDSTGSTTLTTGSSPQAEPEPEPEPTPEPAPEPEPEPTTTQSGN